MKKIFLKVLPAVAAFMGFKPEAKQKLEWSDKDKQKLDKEAGTDGFADAFMKYHNEEHVVEQQEANAAFDEFMETFNAQAPKVETNADAEEIEVNAAEEVPTGDEKTVSENLKMAVDAANALLNTNAQQAAEIEKLKVLPEEDTPEAVIKIDKKNASVKHSKTHLFASKNSWDSLDRPWNSHATGTDIKAVTDWGNKVNIEQLNSDLQDYSRRNSNMITSLFQDGFDIPDSWNVVSNIQDEYVSTSIVSGTITQGLKKKWLPKNKQRFIPIKNKIFDKQIDIEWSASELKKIEKSWLNMFFNMGSTPYKIPFAQYLITELLKQARKEDKISLFKGVYYDTELLPADVPGDFLNAMDGFFKLIDSYRNQVYKAHDLPVLTPENTYTVINKWVREDIHIDFRNNPNLELGIGPDVHRWYWEGKEREKGTNIDYTKQDTFVEDKSNVRFRKIAQFEGTGFIYLTGDDNIGIMIDRAGEDSNIILEMLKRAIYGTGDYKLGVWFGAFGGQVDPDADPSYDNQIFFSNNVPLAIDTYIPVESNDATPSFKEHHALVIGAHNTAATNITQFDDVEAGKRYYVYGNGTNNLSTIQNNANIILQDGNFPLKNGSKMVLIGQPDGKVLEYSRTASGQVTSVEKVELAAGATEIDAAEGTHFFTASNVAATAINNIIGALIDEEYTIEGGSNNNASTIANAGNFVLTAAFTANEGNYLKVVYNGSKFVELSRG